MHCRDHVIKMTASLLKNALRTLTLQGLESITASTFGFDGFQGATAYYDGRKDDLVTPLPSFRAAVEALKKSEVISNLFGATQAPRIALQFVFMAYADARNWNSHEAAFESVWNGFVRELDTPTWTFAAVANIQNVECSESHLELVDGVSLRERSCPELEQLLGWGAFELNALMQDWMETSGSSYVFLLQKKVPKTPDNFLMLDDGNAYVRAERALLALRLVGPGDIRIGRLFLARPASFNVGISGIHSSGFSVWHPGPAYKLTPDKIPDVQRWYEEISSLQSRNDKQTRSLGLALRSFSSIYDRHLHQAEDRVLDAITTLEALWKLDKELTFRLSFRTAALLGETDDERVRLYEIVSHYYKVRSKIVHGTALSKKEAGQVAEDEPIRSIVRRALRAFVHLGNNPSDWTLARLDKEADMVLLHSNRRQSLRVAMGIAG